MLNTPPNAAPYFFPNKHPLTTGVPMWMQLGGFEILYDGAIEFSEKMKLQGNSLALYVKPYANHDILYLGANTGFHTEAINAVKAAGKFLEDVHER